MLRKRLLTRIGLLVAAFVIGAAGAITAMQIVLADVDRANADAAFLIDGIQRVALAASAVEAGALASVSAESSSTPNETDAARDEFLRSLDRLGEHAVARNPGDSAREYAQVRSITPRFLSAWRAVQEATDPASRSDAANAAHLASFEMQREIQRLASEFRANVAQEQAHVGRTFRVMVVALTLAALVMINIAVIVLLRTAQLVLRPVSALLAGSRELAAERFEHRVSVPHQDEFAELARAYNTLAEALQASEARKAEALRQLAVTLNHRLNNAMGIIEMQLALLDRQPATSAAGGAQLREIRASLADMAQMVASLKHIRRVVLTDYGPGQKMVDVEQSLRDDPAIAPPARVTT